MVEDVEREEQSLFSSTSMFIFFHLCVFFSVQRYNTFSIIPYIFAGGASDGGGGHTNARKTGQTH
jgi:hypothetical protein